MAREPFQQKSSSCETPSNVPGLDSGRNALHHLEAYHSFLVELHRIKGTMLRHLKEG